MDMHFGEPSFQPPQEPATPQEKPERRKGSTKLVGAIIHDALGISFTGEPTKPLSLEELRAKYTDKEISNSLKAAVFGMAMEDFAQDLEPHTFEETQQAITPDGYEQPVYEPQELCDQFGEVSMPLINGYIQGLLAERAEEYLTTTFSTAYPVACQALESIARGPAPDPERVQLIRTVIPEYGAYTEELSTPTFEAIQLGVESIMALYTFVASLVPEHEIGPTMERSMGVLYKLAYQEVMTALDAYVPATFDMKTSDPENIEILVEKTKAWLLELPPEDYNLLVTEAVSALLKVLEWDSIEDAEYIDATVVLETSLLRKDTEALNYISGAPTSLLDSFSSEVQAFFFQQQRYVFSRCLGFFADHESPAAQRIIKNAQAIQELEVRTLSDEFFELTRDAQGRPLVALKEVGSSEPGRSDILLFRQPTMDGVPGDLAETEFPVMGCAAMYSSIPYTESLRQMAELTGFQPKKLNGIGFTTLMALNVIRQVKEQTTSSTAGS
jgi:hypothetical protein